MSSGHLELLKLNADYADAPRWMQIAAGELGQREADPYSRVSDYFKASGKTPDIRGTSWCRYFVNYCLKKDGWSVPNDGMARGLLNWGEAVKEPKLGDLVILWRGTHDDGVTGHIGFFIKWDMEHVWLVGGNQGDSVSEGKYLRSKIIGIRRPRSMLKSKTNWTGGALQIPGWTTIVEGLNTPDTVEKASETKGLLEQALQYFPNYKLMLGVMIVGLGLFVIYNRQKDNKEKGV